MSSNPYDTTPSSSPSITNDTAPSSVANSPPYQLSDQKSHTSPPVNSTNTTTSDPTPPSAHIHSRSSHHTPLSTHFAPSTLDSPALIPIIPKAPPKHLLSNPFFSSIRASPDRHETYSLSRPEKRKTGFKELLKAYGMRASRLVRRGNIIVLLLFLVCAVFFFSALSGVGYVDQNSSSLSSTADDSEYGFIPSVPIRSGGKGKLRQQPDYGSSQARLRRMEEERQLEQEWGKKKRPKDGAWMQAVRDDKAVRRVGKKVIPEVKRSVDESEDAFGKGL